MISTRSILLGAAGVIVLSALCTGSAWTALRLARDETAEAWKWCIVAVAIAGPLAAALAARAAIREGVLTKLRASLEVEGSAGLSCIDVPAWVRPLCEAFNRRLTQETQRADLLTGRLREAEIRLSIAEAERRHTETILQSLRDAVIVTDPFNELTLANASAARLLGFDQSGSTHKPIEEIIKDDELRRMIKEVRQSGMLSKQRHVEHSMQPAGPARNSVPPASFDVTIACLPPRLPEGTAGAAKEVGGVVTILRDITREKEISQMKSDFVSQASHELRTPIASINAYVEMLLDAEAQDEETRQEFYGIIKTETERLSRMIDNMLNISRIEAGIVSVDRTEVDFAKVIREVIETMQPQAKAKNITLQERIGPLIYTAEADRDMMHQVILNLVSNAIKYTPEGGRTTVSVEMDDASRSILVAVQDTGLGIPPESIDKVFGKFFRIESYKRMAKGTGLGLNLVKHIVETVHHGQVGVTSQVGMGSRFWFTVPFEFQSGRES
ncbi:MAG: PAS domain-containing protein [Phycisphaerae bacterium]|nr:PAS domain-containing protein [Phycisphaerae bacterium]